MEWILIVFIGLAASSLGSLIGLGGGIIVVPALLYITTLGILPDITPREIVGTSLFTMIFTGMSSTIGYIKHKTIDYKSGLIFLAGSAPGGIFGAWMIKNLDAHAFNLYFGLFVLFVSVVMVLRNKIKPIPYNKESGYTRTFTDMSGQTFEYGYNPVVGILISVAIGFISGLFGVGGGSLMVPAMILFFYFPPHVAVATSMFMIFLSSIISSVAHISLGNIHWMYALALIPGAWIGAQVGVYLNSRLKSKTIVMILRAILIIIGIRLIYEGLTG
ncbi:sulfite exporter TauE/SafE family protein [Neobacillus notoginsengisoli]|uniref:Probable membrane transporter protein n=1 Tax=Neobacillus notoginsengisoli TaxID=1578198 RepID=A0A417YY30_9BACI|nr:sulfite exporter TauE/SafE family protein [Neobacillus notoginsengisoli]RHW42659.1 sulfite exporter TauE/SafE family protein [Neobacillus notoginsengisoli]